MSELSARKERGGEGMGDRVGIRIHHTTRRNQRKRSEQLHLLLGRLLPIHPPPQFFDLTAERSDLSLHVLLLFLHLQHPCLQTLYPRVNTVMTMLLVRLLPKVDATFFVTCAEIFMLSRLSWDMDRARLKKDFPRSFSPSCPSSPFCTALSPSSISSPSSSSAASSPLGFSSSASSISSCAVLVTCPWSEPRNAH
mmetsp:Transcript_20268/g.67620  ORF Transcript_20268/g.67620 Transcript_20268/m.67620 type:complete len:195 (+) Transcript_20268:558-1142(+)